jgi:hypothetical protein
MIAATYKNSQETLRRQEDMALKLNALTEFVSKLRFNADESSDKNLSFIAVDNLIKKFPMNDLSDLENFERRFKRKVLNQELAYGNLVCLLFCCKKYLKIIVVFFSI